MKQSENVDTALRWQDAVAPVMFCLALGFLALVAAILVLWIYIPGNIEADEFVAHATSSDPEIASRYAFEQTAFRWGQWIGLVLLVLWPIFWLEQACRYLASPEGQTYTRDHPYWWTCCVFPPLRLCAQRQDGVAQVWLPTLGWRETDRSLRKQLERVFSVPMIFIALLILPVLGLEVYFNERIGEYPALRIALHVSTGLIWFAFALEFIVMVSVTDKKFAYCKKHWLDLAIILLPLISFLRTLRVLRATKLVKVGKLQQLAKMVRVYRLRGVTMRALRALLLLEVVHRLFRISPEKRLKKLHRLLEEKEHELLEIREAIDKLNAQQQLPLSSVADDKQQSLSRQSTTNQSSDLTEEPCQ